ncbi:AsmA family protein [Candidatus Avelusimicrobium faecicola]|uniref:DUF748 domain-containing protein n=1 Tax=Candidatus Avelusimicrobium faecicola TaxID=3416205 RepID=UPI003D13D34F
MKKLLKWIFICGVLGVALLGAGVITLKVMYPPQKLKAMAVSYAKDNFHREIAFDKVSFNLIGVTLTDFALSEAETFAQGTFIKADKLQVKVALLPLLHKKVEIRTVSLDGLAVNVIKQKDGSFNFDSLLAAPTAQQDAPADDSANADEALGLDLTAGQININNCAFSYKDLQTGMSAAVNKLNLKIRDFDLKKIFSLKIQFTTAYQEGDLSASVPVTVDTAVNLANLDLPQAYVNIKAITAQYKNMRFLLKGQVKNFAAPEVDLTGTLSGLDQRTFADFLPDLPEFSLPEITVKVNAAADLDKSTADIRQLKLAVLNSGFTASGTAGWGAANPVYQVKGNLALHLGEIVQMTSSVADFKPEGKITGSFTATDKKDGKDVSGSVVLKNVSALYDVFTLKALNGAIKITSLDDISCPVLTGLFNGEKFTSSFSYKNIKDVLNLGLNLDLSKLTLDKFPAADEEQAGEQPSAQTQAAPAAQDGSQMLMNIKANVKIGTIKIPYFTAEGFNINADLTRVSAAMDKANGQVDFTLQPGAITDLDSLVKDTKIVKILLLPITLVNKVGKALNVEIFPAENAAKKGQITFSSAEGKYTFVNGVMNVDKTSLVSKLTNVNGSGTVDFPKNDINMKVSATVLTSQTPIVMKITGTLDNPKGKLDVLNTVGSLVGGILNYKTPGKVVSGTASTAGNVATGAVKTTGKVAQSGVDTVKSTLKGIGGLFKKSKNAGAKSTPAK